MRLTQALAILSALSLASSLSTGNQNPRQQRRSDGLRSNAPFSASLSDGANKGSSSSTASSARRVARTTEDIFGDLATNNDKRKTNVRKRSAPRPPLVDSALLRFLSKQKQMHEENSNNSNNGQEDPAAAANDNLGETAQAVADNNLPSQDRSQFSLEDNSSEQQQQQLQPQPTKQQVQERPPIETSGGESSVPVEETTTTAVVVETELAAQLMAAKAQTQLQEEILPKADDTLDQWMGQFNRNRVAKVLLSTGDGVEQDLANQAGESVQRLVLARTARRRVREFLKERDSLWVEGPGSSSSQAETNTYTDDKEQESSLSSSSSTTANTPQQPDYGFADVVDVLVENGLTAKDIATILTHTPSIALMRPKRMESTAENNDAEAPVLGGETIEETVQRAFSQLLCSTLQLRRYDARKVLRNCPGLLTKRGSRSAQQVVAAMSKLGVSTNSMARDKNALPALLSRPPAALFRLIAFLSSDAIRMPVHQIGPLIRRNEALELLDAVCPVPRSPPTARPTSTTADKNEAVLTDSKILPAFVGRSMEERKKVIDATYETMSTTAWTLRTEIGTSDLGKVIAAYPSVLLLDASEQVLPVAEYLMEDLGIWEDDLAKVLQLYPTVLGNPVSKMQKTVSFILAQGVEEENLASIFRSFPALLTLDVEKDMVPVVEFLRSIGIKNVGRFISRLPPILGYSVERDLIPKWEFVRDIYTFPSFELSKFPAYFSYPLDRIKARFEYLRNVKSLPISLIAPDLVLRYGDEDFAVKVAGDGDGGLGYSEYLKQRQRQNKGPGNRKNNNKNRQRKQTSQKQQAQQ